MGEKQFYSREVNHLLGGSLRLLVVACEPAETIKPCESTFHNPSEGFWCEAVYPVGGGADFNVYIKVLLYLIYKIAAVSTVNKPFPYRGPRIRHLPTKGRREMRVMYLGTAYQSPKNESVTVDGNVTFDALYLFIGIEAVMTHTVAPFHTLCVKRHYGRSRSLFPFASNSHDEILYAMLYPSGMPPLSKIPVHCIPSGKVMRKHAPLATADEDVENCFKEGTQGIFAMSAIIFKEYFVYIRPLTLGQMCLIEEGYMHDNLFFLLTTLWLRVFRAYNV